MPPPIEIVESCQVDLIVSDLSTTEDIEGLVADLYWHSDDQYYLFFKHGLGIDGALLKQLELHGIALRKTEGYFYRHPNAVSDKDFVRILPGAASFEWQRQAAAEEMFDRVTLALEPWRRKAVEADAIASAIARSSAGRHLQRSGTDIELEQKFRILRSPTQAQRDFDRWVAEGTASPHYAIGVIFLDIDNFKQINSRLTETVVDRTILPEVQQLIRRLCLHRAAAYRQDGEEVLVLLPNHRPDEASSFAERLRASIEAHQFEADGERVDVTVSVGVAAWPGHGDRLDAVTEAANRAEHIAKEQGRIVSASRHITSRFNGPRLTMLARAAERER